MRSCPKWSRFWTRSAPKRDRTSHKVKVSDYVALLLTVVQRVARSRATRQVNLDSLNGLFADVASQVVTDSSQQRPQPQLPQLPQIPQQPIGDQFKNVGRDFSNMGRGIGDSFTQFGHDVANRFSNAGPESTALTDGLTVLSQGITQLTQGIETGLRGLLGVNPLSQSPSAAIKDKSGASSDSSIGRGFFGLFG